MRALVTVGLLLALVSGGCMTTSQEARVYKSLGAIGYTVDGAMTAYANAVAEGQIDAETQMEVRRMHKIYQPIFNASVRAASQDMTTLAPDELAVIAAELVAVILNATQL